MIERNDTGVHFDVEVPDITWARDVVIQVDRGDIDQMSFGFRVLEDEWEFFENDIPFVPSEIWYYSRSRW